LPPPHAERFARSSFKVEGEACQRSASLRLMRRQGWAHPGASGSLDQMRNVQSSESRGADGAANAKPTLVSDRVSNKSETGTPESAGVDIVFVSDAEPFLANGCEDGAVFFGDVTQQLILRQQRALQAF